MASTGLLKKGMDTSSPSLHGLLDHCFCPISPGMGQKHRPKADKDSSLGLLTDPAQDGLIEVLTINGAEEQHLLSAGSLRETREGTGTPRQQVQLCDSCWKGTLGSVKSALLSFCPCQSLGGAWSTPTCPDPLQCITFHSYCTLPGSCSPGHWATQASSMLLSLVMPCTFPQDPSFPCS